MQCNVAICSMLDEELDDNDEDEDGNKQGGTLTGLIEREIEGVDGETYQKLDDDDGDMDGFEEHESYATWT